MNTLINNYRNSINPPYRGNDFFVLGATFLVLLVAFVAVISLPNSFDETYQGESQAAAEGTFTGQPATPMPFSQHPEYADWDVQHHVRSGSYWGDDSFNRMDAQHGPNCEPPPATHSISSYKDTVYICRDHLMTATNDDSGYSAVILTPNWMADWSNGPVTISFNMSTHQTSGRDWVDFWISPFGKAHVIPLSDAPDVQPEARFLQPQRGEFLNLKGIHGGEGGFRATNQIGDLGNGCCYLADSMAQRDRFEITIDRNVFSFCKVTGEPNGQPICFFTNTPHGLSFTRAVFQIGHHGYTPAKAECWQPSCPSPEGLPGTWHWDNITATNKVPFTIIKANKRYFTGYDGVSDTIRFNTPAPANSFLRFSSHGGEVRVNGQLVQAQMPHTHYETVNLYHVPIPQGSQEVTIQLSKGIGWFGGPYIAKDFHIWSETTSAQPTSVSTPTPLTTVAPTNTPTPTSVPQGSATLNLTRSSATVNVGQTMQVNLRVDSGTSLINAVQSTLNYPSNLLTMTGVTYSNVFPQQAQETLNPGTVTMVRGTTTPVSGVQLVATINFQAIAAGVANFTLTNNQVVSSQTNTSIFSSATGTSVTLVAPTPTPTNTPTPTRTPTPTATPTPVRIPGDANNNGVVDLVDFSILLSDWAPVNNPRSDFNNDGHVGIADFSILLSNWTN